MKLLPWLKSSKGFTLIELLVALTILVILAVTVYVALDPAKRLADAKDARRSSDVDSILTAIHQSIVDNKGVLPTNLAAVAVDAEVQLGTGDAIACPANAGAKCTSITADCIDLMTGTQNVAKYLASMPIDPDTVLASSVKTGYSVKRDANGIVTVKACHTNGTPAIQVSR